MLHVAPPRFSHRGAAARALLRPPRACIDARGGIDARRGSRWHATSSAPAAMLTPEQVDAYHRDGFLIPPQFVLPPAALRALREALEEVVSDNSGVRPERLVRTRV